MMINIAIFYAVGAVIVGVLIAVMGGAVATWNGKPIPYARLFVPIIGGAMWPVALVQLLIARNDKRDTQP